MIKGNESDVRNIDFELQAKRGDKFLCFTLFELDRTVPISSTRCLMRWSLDQNVAIQMDK